MMTEFERPPYAPPPSRIPARRARARVAGYSKAQLIADAFVTLTAAACIAVVVVAIT